MPGHDDVGETNISRQIQAAMGGARGDATSLGIGRGGGVLQGATALEKAAGSKSLKGVGRRASDTISTGAGDVARSG